MILLMTFLKTYFTVNSRLKYMHTISCISLQVGVLFTSISFLISYINCKQKLNILQAGKETVENLKLH